MMNPPAWVYVRQLDLPLETNVKSNQKVTLLETAIFEIYSHRKYELTSFSLSETRAIFVE